MKALMLIFAVAIFSLSLFGQSLSLVSENRLLTRFLLDGSRVSLAFPKSWSVSSPELVLRQGDLDEVIQQAKSRFNAQSHFYDGLNPQETTSGVLARSVSFNKLYCEANAADISELGMAEAQFYFYRSARAKAMADKQYDDLKVAHSSSPKEMFSSGIIESIKSGVPVWSLREVKLNLDGVNHALVNTYYWFQFESGVLHVLTQTDSNTTEKQLSELKSIINRTRAK